MDISDTDPSGRRPAPRRRIGRGGTLIAAAAVVAVVVALVLVKVIPNGSTVPASPTTSTGPGGVPRYYVALQRFPKNNARVGPADIVVGDALTGQTIATFAPPVHANFWSVSAAADDRTFIVEALTPANSAMAPLLWPSVGAGTITASWFEVHLAPGTTHPATLTSLPVKPESWVSPGAGHNMYDPATAGVVSAAVSQSGTELAVLDVPAAGREEVQVFSIATGQLLHDWTTDNPSVRVPIAWVVSTAAVQALTWIDGDRELAFPAITAAQITSSTGNPSGAGTLRSLKVAGPARGDLLADSTPGWSGQLPFTAPLTSCFSLDSWPQQVSADGKTVSCAQGDKSRLTFVTDPLTAGSTGTIDYQLKTAQQAEAAVLWTSPSGGTLIVAWTTSLPLAQPTVFQFGVLSHGAVTPLRFPSGLTTAVQPGDPYPIAF